MKKNFRTRKMSIESMANCLQACHVNCSCTCDCKDVVNFYGISVGVSNQSSNNAIANQLAKIDWVG